MNSFTRHRRGRRGPGHHPGGSGAARAWLAAPPTRLADPDDRPDASWFPLVAKPRRADGARGLAFLATPAALEAFLAAPPQLPGNVEGEPVDRAASLRARRLP